MAKWRFFTVGFELPGNDFERVDIGSDRTLLDADIVLFEPSIPSDCAYENYNGRPLLSESASFTSHERMKHWHSEILGAVKAGRLVIIYLSRPIERFRYTGEAQFSGTGRSRVKTNLVVPCSSYDSVPVLTRSIPKNGNDIQLEKDASFLAPYFKEFAEGSSYEVDIEGPFTRPLLKSRVGDRIVGAMLSLKEGTGTLLFLPPLHIDEKVFTTKTSDWNSEGLRFGKRLAAALASIATTLKNSTGETPPPSWATVSRYRLSEEGELQCAISACSAEIAERQAKKIALELELAKCGNLRRLLFEQGRPLELAILESLRLLGFEAKPFSDGESEFDAVFSSSEGRCIGEAEGRDNKAINIDKFSQLERNLQEDFSHEDIASYAKGVLFGNAFRLLPLHERSEFFTQKCISAATRVKAALIRTPDLFDPAKYLKEYPNDQDYAKRCRDAIFRTEGSVVVFPAPPEGGTLSTVAQATREL